MSKINMKKHIWEGWTVGDFIEELSDSLAIVQSRQGWDEPIKTRQEMIEWIGDNQPYVKKPIPEVVEYFCEKYNL